MSLPHVSSTNLPEIRTDFKLLLIKMALSISFALSLFTCNFEQILLPRMYWDSAVCLAIGSRVGIPRNQGAKDFYSGCVPTLRHTSTGTTLP
jgi:hypothetical protein